MKTSILYTHVRRFAPAVLALAVTAVLGACGVTGPDETPWQNVADYSWPTTNGTSMKYRVEMDADGDGIIATTDSTTISMVVTPTNIKLHDFPMYRLDSTNRVVSQRVLFSARPDTLYIGNGDMGREEFGGTYHLVAPLQRGHSWISGYRDDAETIPKWKATIIERLSHLQLEGHRYQNIVVAKYELVDTSAPDYGSYWIRYYAQGEGPILTIKNLVLQRDASGNPSREMVETRTVLIEPHAVANN
jgi:hypothetical protein